MLGLGSEALSVWVLKQSPRAKGFIRPSTLAKAPSGKQSRLKEVRQTAKLRLERLKPLGCIA